MQKESVIQLCWKVIKGVAFLPFWWTQRFVKRDEKIWIFGAWKGERYSDNSKAMFEYVIANHQEIQAWWVTRDEIIFEKLNNRSLPVVMACSKQGKKLQKQASVAFISWGIDGDMDARYLNGCQILFLWHGMPLKKIGRDEWSFKRRETPWKKFKTVLREIILPYEFIQQKAVEQNQFKTISASPFFTPFIQSAWQLSKQYVLEIGQPRNDNLFSSKVENYITELNRCFNHPVKVMYMPTFRDSVGCGFNPFKMAGFDVESFRSTLQEQNMVFIYKGHFCDQSTLFSDGGRIMTIGDNDYDDLYTFVKDIDILITDYSSIYFDFLLCRKPIILFPFDENDYVTYSRPFYFNYGLMEGKRVYSWPELENALKNKDYWTLSEKTITLFNAHIDGDSCKRLFNVLCHE